MSKVCKLFALLSTHLVGTYWWIETRVEIVQETTQRATRKRSAEALYKNADWLKQDRSMMHPKMA